MIPVFRDSCFFNAKYWSDLSFIRRCSCSLTSLFSSSMLRWHLLIYFHAFVPRNMKPFRQNKIFWTNDISTSTFIGDSNIDCSDISFRKIAHTIGDLNWVAVLFTISWMILGTENDKQQILHNYYAVKFWFAIYSWSNEVKLDSKSFHQKSTLNSNAVGHEFPLRKL